MIGPAALLLSARLRRTLVRSVRYSAFAKFPFIFLNFFIGYADKKKLFFLIPLLFNQKNQCSNSNAE